MILAIEGQMKGILKDLKALRKGTQSQTEATEELGDAAENTGKKLKNAFDIKQLGAWVLSIQKYTNSMIKVTKAQVDYNKSMQRLQVAYGEVNSNGEKLVKTMADLSGLDIAQLTSSLATFRQFTSSLGLANEEASLLSENLLKFVNDLSSYYGEDFDEMSRKVISGITGEAEALKILGADVTDNAIKQKAFNLGIQTNTTNMSAATKAVLRYLLIIDQLKNAQGNYAATINDVSNQTKIWNAQIDTLKRQLGAFLLPILQTILPVLNGILMVVNELLGMLLGFFGIEVPFASIVDYSSKFKNNMNGANEATKAAQKSLRGFDKLNVIKTPTTSGTGTDYGKVDPKALEALDEYNDKLKEAHNKAVKIRDTIMEWLGFGKVEGKWKFLGVTFGTIAASAAVVGGVVLAVLKVIKGIQSIKGIIDKLFGLGGVKDKGSTTGTGSSFKLPNWKSLGKGLAELAVIITAVEVYVAALGALIEKFPNIEDWIETGTDALVTTFTGIAKILIPLAGLTGLSLLTSTGKVTYKGLGELAAIISGTDVLILAIGGLVSLAPEGIIEAGINSVVTVFEGIGKILIPLALLTGLSFLVGSNGIAILEGLGVLAVIMLALTAFFEAMGAIMEIAPGEEIIEKGINIMCLVFEGIGRMVGALIGGVVEGLIDSATKMLPEVGTRLSLFAENGSAFFETVNNIDESAAKGAECVAKAILALTVANVLNGISGIFGVLGAIKTFATIVGFGKAMNSFQKALGKDFDAEFVTSAAHAGKALAEMNDALPTVGGIKGWFTGKKSLTELSKDLPEFGLHMALFYSWIKNIKPEIVEAAANSGKSLAELYNALPEKGGFFSWFTGEQNLASFSEDLVTFGTNFNTYYTKISGIEVAKVNAVSESLKIIIDCLQKIDSGDLGDVASDFGDDLEDMAKGITKLFKTSISKGDATKIANSFGSSIGKAISDGIKKKLSITNIKLQDKSGFTVKNLGTYSLKAYAQGGFPTKGDLFLANERTPEYVGSIGGQTAVANNDQIVDGISAGVAKAIMATGRNVNVNITAEGDAEGLLDFITFKQKQKDRQYGF
jgi:hypothetical protein